VSVHFDKNRFFFLSPPIATSVVGTSTSRDSHLTVVASKQQHHAAAVSASIRVHPRDRILQLCHDIIGCGG
jgi:hypothetical protein